VTRKFERIIIVRSSVQSRDQGFLPGTEEEKMAKFEEPYRDITSELFEDNTIYQKLKAETKIIFRSTSCIRGLTWNNAAVVVDEVENLGYQEIGSVITRLGNESRIMFVGDTKQTDLRRRHDDECGLPKLLAVTRRMPSMREVIFNKLDIVRGGVVREWIIAEEELSS
jgi:predicted ribonuclease YlaK